MALNSGQASKTWTEASQSYFKITPPIRLEAQARRNVDRFVRHGTLTVLSHSGAGLDLTAEVKAIRSAAKSEVSAQVLTAFDTTPFLPIKRDDDGHVDWICSTALPKLAARNLMRFAHAIYDADGYRLEQVKAILNCAKRLGLRASFEGDVTARLGCSQLAAELEVRHVAGLNYADQDDAVLLSRSRVLAVLIPADVRDGRSTRFPPARLLLDNGAAVALASGFGPTLPAPFGMQSVISMACSYMKMTPEEAITAATLNAAYAIDMEQVTGSLQFGKQADLLVLDIPDYRAIPYNLGANLVQMVMRKGEIAYREGEVVCAE